VLSAVTRTGRFVEAFLRESAIDIRCLNNPRPVWPSNVVYE